jgi:cysteine-rich repeat protein
MIFPPFDTDRSFVFGVDAAGTQVMAVALSPESSVGALRGAVAIEPGDIWRAVEGSEGEQLFFSTSRPSEMDPSLKHALHRWRKPACSAQIPICSDGCIIGREQCDDGNESNADWCLQNCALATCGDGFLRIGVEECDDGNTANDDGCSTTCENEP